MQSRKLCRTTDRGRRQPSGFLFRKSAIYCRKVSTNTLGHFANIASLPGAVGMAVLDQMRIEFPANAGAVCSGGLTFGMPAEGYAGSVGTREGRTHVSNTTA